MSKGYKIAIVVSLIILALLVVMLIVQIFGFGSGKKDVRQDPAQIGLVLPIADEEALGGSTSQFVKFYNSYFYDQYNSATNIAELGTTEFQQQALDRKEQLETFTAQDYYIDTNPKDDSFSYTYMADGTVEATIRASVVEFVDSAEKSYEVKYYLTFVRIGTTWKISAVRYVKL